MIKISWNQDYSNIIYKDITINGYAANRTILQMTYDVLYNYLNDNINEKTLEIDDPDISYLIELSTYPINIHIEKLEMIFKLLDKYQLNIKYKKRLDRRLGHFVRHYIHHPPLSSIIQLTWLADYYHYPEMFIYGITYLKIYYPIQWILFDNSDLPLIYQSDSNHVDEKRLIEVVDIEKDAKYTSFNIIIFWIHCELYRNEKDINTNIYLDLDYRNFGLTTGMDYIIILDYIHDWCKKNSEITIAISGNIKLYDYINYPLDYAVRYESKYIGFILIDDDDGNMKYRYADDKILQKYLRSTYIGIGIIPVNQLYEDIESFGSLFIPKDEAMSV